MGSKLRTSWVCSRWSCPVLLGSLAPPVAYRGDFGAGPIGEIAPAATVLVGPRGARNRCRVGRRMGGAVPGRVAGPYRRGDVTSWWGILVSLVVLTAVVGARVPFTGNPLGIGTPLTLLALGIVALLLDVKRLSGPR
jgi:hypothetical protein